MKLLICAQAVDKNDPMLGFFVAWVAELSTHYEQVTVLCLREGEHKLPPNVTVLCLGRGRLMRLAQLLRYIVVLRKNYDAVFVHMSQEFVLAAGWLWTLLGKKIYLWRNHYAGSLLTSFAARSAATVFYTSAFSYTARYRNAVRMPVGVVLQAVPALPRVPHSVLFLGRIAPSKRPELLLEAARLLTTPVQLSFVGPADKAYLASLTARAPEGTQFSAGVPHADTPRVFAAHELFVNLSPSGMFDKTIFEAASAGCVPFATSKDWGALMPELYVDGAVALARAVDRFFALPEEERARLRNAARAEAERQSLPRLAKRLVEEMS